MTLLLAIAVAVGSLASLTAVVHFSYLAIRRPHTLMRFLAENDHKITGKAYVFLLMIGWAAAGYFVGRGFFSWLPYSVGSSDEYGEFEPLRNTLAAIFGLASLAMIEAFTELARRRVATTRLELAVADLTSLVSQTRGIQHAIDEYERRRDVANDQESRQHYEMMLRLSRTLDEDISRIVAEAEQQQKKTVEAEEKEKMREQAAAVAAAKRQADSKAHRLVATQRRKGIRDSVRSWTAATAFPICHSLAESTIGDWCVADPIKVANRWDVLDHFARAAMSVNKADIRAGRTETRSLEALLQASVATSRDSGASIYASYAGDTHNGTTEIYALVQTEKAPYLSHLRFDESIDGLIEGLYWSCGAIQHGVYWHGLYDRDYRFLFTPEDVEETLLDSSSDVSILRQIDRPCGIRFSNEGTGYSMGCIVAFPNGSISDLRVRIASGRLVVEGQQELYVSATRVFY